MNNGICGRRKACVPYVNYVPNHLPIHYAMIITNINPKIDVIFAEDDKLLFQKSSFHSLAYGDKHKVGRMRQ